MAGLRQYLLAAGLVLSLGAHVLAEPSGHVPIPATDISDEEKAAIARRARIANVCDLIAVNARANSLPEAFFARLIWKESRFDPGAVSPVGAEGIAQFMPGTAEMRGLADSFNVEQALRASAVYLAELRRKYGNLGLAAAAYNSGEGRVSRWLASGGFLPLETEAYVIDILGAAADTFIDAADGDYPALDPKKSFAQACRDLPVSRVTTVPMSQVSTRPWAVQVAGNIRRDAAIRQFARVKARAGELLEGHEIAVSRVRSARGRRGIYAVRVGMDSRAEADTLCRRLRGVGGSCITRRNR